MNVDCPVCGNGIVEVGELCDGGDCCTPNCTFAASSLQCRSAAGPCDLAEFCTGSSADCPADAVQPPGFECRASAGVCDMVEFCDGASADCPADGFEPSTTECRAVTTECDVAEFCTGFDENCPANAFAPSGTTCPDDGDECTSDQCNGQGVCVHVSGGSCGACCTASGLCVNDVLPDTCAAQGGASAGPGSTCLGDTDGDGVDDLCDRCPGVDDAVFAPGCVGAIPTVSHWGLVILALALLALGKAYGLRRFEATA